MLLQSFQAADLRSGVRRRRREGGAGRADSRGVPAGAGPAGGRRTDRRGRVGGSMSESRLPREKTLATFDLDPAAGEGTHAARQRCETAPFSIAPSTSSPSVIPGTGKTHLLCAPRLRSSSGSGRPSSSRRPSRSSSGCSPPSATCGFPPSSSGSTASRRSCSTTSAMSSRAARRWRCSSPSWPSATSAARS